MQSNAKEIAARFLRRARALDSALLRGLRTWAIRVDREQVKNLSGTGEPGSYPVPLGRYPKGSGRTGGTLRGGHFFRVARGFAVVGNTTEYAQPIHDGELVTREGVRYAVKPRPFLDEAAAAVDGGAIMAAEVRGAMAVR